LQRSHGISEKKENGIVEKNTLAKELEITSPNGRYENCKIKRLLKC